MLLLKFGFLGGIDSLFFKIIALSHGFFVPRENNAWRLPLSGVDWGFRIGVIVMRELGLRAVAVE